MTNQERIDQIKEAMELIEEARSMIHGAIDGTSESNHFFAYGEYGFSTLLGDGNPYDASLLTLIKEIENS